MEYTEALRRMAIADSDYTAALLRADDRVVPEVDPKTLALVRIAALAGAGASVHSYAVEVDKALCAGAMAAEIVSVLTGIAPVIGSAALAAAAPALALALGYDTEVALERLDPP
jgi:alkylhydroperoxidase/carboxymuconolactone decarboxylase family protein YurZ